MLSPYRNQPKITTKRSKQVSNTNFDKTSRREHDFKRPQMTSIDIAKPETNTKSNRRNKNILKSWIYTKEC